MSEAAEGRPGREIREDRLVLLANSPRLPPGQLSWPAWAELRSGAAVLTGDPEHPQLPYLRAAGVAVEVLTPDRAVAAGGPRVSSLPGGGIDPVVVALTHVFRDRARNGGHAVWLAGPADDAGFVRALGDLVAREGAAGVPVTLEVVYGSYDPPGSRLLDVVETMDRLRSPGGCPWDAEQTHASLARYLLEEAYEAYQALEDGDLDALREELGDVLLQVVFHARIARERTDGTGWSIDDVAAGLVDKLVRRHPHVFAGREVSGAAEVVTNWESIKEAEKGRTSVTEGVPLAAPALTLAATLQKRAAAVRLPVDLLGPPLAATETAEQAVAAAAAAITENPSSTPVQAVGDLLFAAVALARAHGVDPEVALRGTARRFRDRLAAVERSMVQDAGDASEAGEVLEAGEGGGGPGTLSAAQWRERWAAVGVAAPSRVPGADEGDLRVYDPDRDPNDELDAELVDGDVDDDVDDERHHEL